MYFTAFQGCKSCPQVYLGETQQWFPLRIHRYQQNYAIKNKTSTNGLAQHVMKTEQIIDWDSTNFLDSDSHWRRKKINETLFIDSLNPQKQMSNIIMNFEKGFEIFVCWKEFNFYIRKISCKKV